LVSAALGWIVIVPLNSAFEDLELAKRAARVTSAYWCAP
jgi:hypothetical protein